ncbi:MAG: hypothetical protein ABEI52_01265 [Halobacteriaceae archaeon]
MATATNHRITRSETGGITQNLALEGYRMNAYIYRAALYCETCTQIIMEGLTTPEGYPDEYTYDSDDYPKGPIADGGGESDIPEHCDKCGQFLENPLTDDGRLYLEDLIRDRYVYGNRADDVINEWIEFYGDSIRLPLLEKETYDDIREALVRDVIPSLKVESQDPDTGHEIQLTIATDDHGTDWAYQTGDNSYHGAAYFFPHWGIAYVTPESDPMEVYLNAIADLEEMVAQATV